MSIKMPSPEVLEKLSIYFSVPVSELLEEEQKNSPSDIELTEGEMDLIKLFRLIPEDQQPVVLAMIRAALGQK